MRAPEETAVARRPRRSSKKAVVVAEPNVEVRRSAIQGRGVFATRDIGAEERIIEYTGERISHDEATERYDDESVRRHHTFLFTVDDDHCIDGGRQGNEARFINHSCEPNAYAVVQKKRIFIKSLREITTGEEIVYDYWYTTDPAYTDEDLRRLYPCRCGAAACRGTLAAPAKKPRKARSEAPAKRASRRNGSR